MSNTSRPRRKKGPSRGPAMSRPSVTWAETVRDVLVRAIDKGQAPLFVGAGLVGIMLMRMPEEQIGQLAIQVLDQSLVWYRIGWALFFVTVVAWFFHARFQRRLMTGEVARISSERNRLQSDQLQRRLTSSNQSSHTQ